MATLFDDPQHSRDIVSLTRIQLREVLYFLEHETDRSRRIDFRNLAAVLRRTLKNEAYRQRALFRFDPGTGRRARAERVYAIELLHTERLDGLLCSRLGIQHTDTRG